MPTARRRADTARLDYRQGGYRGYYNDYCYRHGQRKKSFLSELFD